MKKLGSKLTKRIGLMWSGNPQNENDHNRSMKLKDLINLFETPFEFHSLQIDYNKFDLSLEALSLTFKMKPNNPIVLIK